MSGATTQGADALRIRLRALKLPTFVARHEELARDRESQEWGF